MGAKNKVVAGDYQNYLVQSVGNTMLLLEPGKILAKKISIDRTTVETYEVVTDDVSKSAVSGVARGAVGVALLGPIGLLAGLSAKNKGVYNVAIKFKAGQNSLVEIDDKKYKALVKLMF